MFDDSPEPFDPTDNVPKPNVGDILVLRKPTDLGWTHGIVTLLYGSLAEDWETDGEMAWAQRDINEEVGYRGHWYAVIRKVDSNDELDVDIVASYEVKEIV